MKNKVILVVPVYNEEKLLEDSIFKLHDYMTKNLNYPWKIVIANNASTDKTRSIGEKLVKRFSRVQLINIPVKGRGYALRNVWPKFDAEVYAYCDVDLATDINFLKPLFDSILHEGYNMVLGNRYLLGSKSNRTLVRIIYSKGFNFLARFLFKTKITDFQCGFKAIDNDVLNKVLPLSSDNGWLFDTELTLLVESFKIYRIKQLPVIWSEHAKDSKVNLILDAFKMGSKLIKLKFKIKSNN